MPWLFDPEIGLYFAPPSSGGPGGTPASTVTDETSFGITPAVGMGTNYAREDHTHGSPPAPSGSGGGDILLATTYDPTSITGLLFASQYIPA